MNASSSKYIPWITYNFHSKRYSFFAKENKISASDLKEIIDLIEKGKQE